VSAGKSFRTEAWTVLAALAAAALLASVLPQRAPAAREAGSSSASVIVRFAPEVPAAQRAAAVRAAGGAVTHDLHLIDGLGVRLPVEAIARLRGVDGVRSVSLARPVASRGRPAAAEPAAAYPAAVGARRTGLTGAGVGVAIIDTGVDAGLPDFQVSRTSKRSRVVAAAVVNPEASDASDGHGHGTHVAGIVAGDGHNRRHNDERRGRYVGIAPDARLISVKIADDEGRATTLDAIYGLQFAVDHAERLGIDVVNLSLASTVPESPATDPLAAAAEAAWLRGLVVVAAAGNGGDDPDAVHHAPGNDPYVITVGASNDRGTPDADDDRLAAWSSRGTTQTGMAKPDVVAPGAGVVSTLARGSEFASLCGPCVTDGQYFQASGTSMATAVAAGVAALLLEAHPDWTPDQVKAAMTAASAPFLRADQAVAAAPDAAASAQHHPRSQLLDPETGEIDYSAASWRAASWRAASWRGIEDGWTCDCSLTDGGELDPQAASWRAASWRVFFRR
jgi:serine protease AprX